MMAAGNSASPYGINAEGLKRRDFSAEQIANIKRAYKTLYKSGFTLAEALADPRQPQESRRRGRDHGCYCLAAAAIASFT